MRPVDASKLTSLSRGHVASLAGVTAVSALLAICLVSISCGQKENNGPPAASAFTSTQPLPQVELATVKSQRLNTTISLPGELMPYEAIDVYARETGFVKSIKVDRGSRVKEGELIAELDAPELIAQRAQANAAYQSAESQLVAAQAKLSADQSTYEHMSSAAKTPGVVAANDLAIAQKTAQSDEANVAALQKTAEAAQEGLRAVTQLESYLNITAPFDGQVTTRYVHPGALVGPSAGTGTITPIVRIETLNRLRLVVSVPENDAAGVPEGTQVSFTAPLFPGRTYHAPIARISHGIDTKTRTMPVELDVRDSHAELVPGTFCEVAWPVRRTYPTLFVPVSAVASDLERTFVIRVANNRTEWVDVTTGVRAGDLMEVFGDLHAGDEVATHATDQLRAGTEVSSRLVSDGGLRR
jgi:membrane fusion protein, multidrug efflux system